MASLRPVAFELSIEDPTDPTIDEIVHVERDPDADSWLANAHSVDDEGGYYPAVVALGYTPEAAIKQLAKVLRLIADRIDPVPVADLTTVNSMVRGLVRCAELKEREGGGHQLWDDASRKALDTARQLGWGKDQTGTLGRL